MLNRSEHWTTSKSTIHHTKGMVTAQHYLAARAGADVLQRGGNAIDAAVGTALALGSVEPWMCGLGGSGLMTVWIAAQGQAYTLDFQGVLGGATDIANYPPDPELPETLMGFPQVRHCANTVGFSAVTIPGAAAGFDRAVARWGTMSLQEVAAPAIALAKSGIPAGWFTTLQTALMSEVLVENEVSRDIYLPNGRPLLPDQILFITGLSRTLERYAQGGAEDFYRGDLSRDIAFDLAEGGSSITAADLAEYQVIEAPANSFTYRKDQLYAPGDSSGGRRLQDFLAHVEQAMPVPGATLAPSDWCIYADGLNAAWRKHNARIGRETEVGSCTSHLSVVDAAGNMVALTHTLLDRFGSGVTLPRSGLLMNNAVSYFDPRPGYPTTMAPHKRINASNMCPAIVARNGVARLAIGASGGNYIMPAVAQVIALMSDFNMSLEAAMNHPRIDASDRGSVRADPNLGAEVLDLLARNHQLEVAERGVFPKVYACVSAVARTQDGFEGLNDPSQPIGGASGPAPMREGCEA